MSDSTFLPDDIVSEMEKYHSGYQSLIRIGDTENPRDLTRIFVKSDTVNDFESSLNEFNGFNGILSSGQEITMNNFFSESYFKFKSNLNLVKQYSTNIKESYKTVTKSVREYVDGDYINVNRQVSSTPLYSLDETLKNESYSFLLYMNGEKIPDTEIYYNNNIGGSTDIFIPKRYIDETLKNGGTIRFDIEERAPGNENVYYYNNNFLGSSIVLNMNDPDLRFIDDGKEIEIKDICIYNNKKFVNIVSSVIKDGANVTITFDNSVTGELELYIRNNIVYRRENDNFIDNSNDTTLQLYIDDDYIFDTLNGPVTKHAISFFYNGLKVYDKQIKQTSRFSYSYSDDSNSTLYYDNIDFYVEDREILIDDKSFSIYGPDYYLLNMLGVKRSVDRLEGNPTNSIFDDPKYFLDFSDTLSDKETLFDMEYQLNDYNHMENTFFNNEDKVKYLISEKPHILRNLLNNYATKSKFYIINGNINDIKISSVEPITDTSKEVLYSLFINTLLVSDTLLTVERVNDIDIITIDKSLLNPGLNTVELVQYNQVKKLAEYYTYTGTTENTISQVTIPLTTLQFSENFNIEDIAILKKVSNDEYYIYANDTQIGYIPFKEDSTEILLYSDNITINFDGDSYPEGFIILDKNFSHTYTVEITDTTGMNFDEEDVILPIVTNLNIPLINDNAPEVYHNGKLLAFSEEYGYKTPFDNEKLACSIITLKIFYDYGDVFRIVFNNTEINVLMTYSDIEINTRYGLLYLEELPFPFSTDYLDLTVNGNKLSKYNIDLLSDKLIRIKGITNPIRSLTVSTRFNVTMGELKPYIDEYWLTPFEELMGMIFYNVNPKNEFNSLYPVTDYIYEQFDENVDSVQKMPNPDEPEDTAEGGLDLLIVMYIRWLYFSKDVRTYVFSDQNVNEDVLRFFKLFKEDLVGNRFDIIVDCNKEYIGLGQDAIKHISEYPMSDFMYANSFMWDTILDISKNNENVMFNEIFDYLKVHPNMNILYPQDLPLTFRYSGGIRPSGKEEDILNFDPKESTLVVPGPTRSEYFFNNNILYNYPDPDSDPEKFTGLYNGELYMNGYLNSDYTIFEDLLYYNGSVAVGEHYYKYNLYTDGVKKIEGGYETINNRLFYNGLIYNGVYSGDSKLYINGVIPIGFYDYNGRISYKGDWFTGIYIDDKFKFEGYDIGEYFIIDGKLYHNGVLNVGYVVFENKLYDNENLNVGYVVFENKLYDNENLNVGYVVFENKLYDNENLNVGLILFENALYNDENLNVGYVAFEDILYKDSVIHNVNRYINLNGKIYINGNISEYTVVDDKLYRYTNLFTNDSIQYMVYEVEEFGDTENEILFLDGVKIINAVFPKNKLELNEIIDGLDNPTLITDVEHIYTGYINDFSGIFMEKPYLEINGINSWDTSNVTDMSHMFDGCSIVANELDLSRFNTSKVVDMSYMFKDCRNVSTFDLTGDFLSDVWDTGNVINMSHMFDGCIDMQDTDKIRLMFWDTSNVTDMSYMFCGCANITQISTSIYGGEQFDTSNVTNMSHIFDGCINLTYYPEIFDTSNVTDMSYMYNGCKNISGPIFSSWNTSNVTDMSYMFCGCTDIRFNSNLRYLVTSNVTNMSHMFDGCKAITELWSFNWDTSNVTDMSYMFANTTIQETFYHAKVSSKTTNISHMFDGCFIPSSAYTRFYFDSWDTSSVTDMSYLFNNFRGLLNYSYTIDFSNFITSNVTDMSYMFANTYMRAELKMDNWNLSKLTKYENMFENFYFSEDSSDDRNITMNNLSTDGRLKIGDIIRNINRNSNNLIGIEMLNFNCENYTDMSYMFYNCDKLSTFYLSNWNTSNVTNMSHMFDGCINRYGGYVNSLSNFDLSKVTDMSYMFYNNKQGDYLATTSDPTNTINVTDMSHMFEGCSNGIANFNDVMGKMDTSSVTNMSCMFKNCTSMTITHYQSVEIDNNVVDMSNMFEGCTNIDNVIPLENWVLNNLTDASDMFNGCTSLDTSEIQTMLDAWKVNSDNSYVDNTLTLSILT